MAAVSTLCLGDRDQRLRPTLATRPLLQPIGEILLQIRCTWRNARLPMQLTAESKLGASTANDVVFALKRLVQDGKIEFVTQVAGPRWARCD